MHGGNSVFPSNRGLHKSCLFLVGLVLFKIWQKNGIHFINFLRSRDPIV